MKLQNTSTLKAMLLGAIAVTGTITAVPVWAQSIEHTVEFATGSAKLDKTALAVVQEAADQFKSGSPQVIHVVGHADTVGNAEKNQLLSEKRAKAVQDKLIAQGVAASLIQPAFVGETDLLVQTADSVPEQSNRVVVIRADAPPPAKVEAAPVKVATQVVDSFKRVQFSVGPYYGYNMSQDENLIGANLSADYYLTKNISIGGEQAIFYPPREDGIGGRSVASIDYHFGSIGTVSSMAVEPYVGANAGYIYGMGVNDDVIYGPEAGISFGPVLAKVAYDISDGGVDNSTISATIGAMFRF